MRNGFWAAITGLGTLSWMFFKIGFVFFGGGYLLIPILQREIVTNLHWLTHREFVDGVAISQLTPGPVAVISTFCGYKQGGAPGAVAATVAVMLPGFILMLIFSYGYEKFRNMSSIRHILNRLVPAITGLLLGASLQMGEQVSRGWIGITMFCIALILMIHWKVNPVLLIAGSAALGLIFRL